MGEKLSLDKERDDISPTNIKDNTMKYGKI